MLDIKTSSMIYNYIEFVKGGLMIAEDDGDEETQNYYKGALSALSTIKSILINECEMEGNGNEYIIVHDFDGYSVCTTKDYRDLMIHNRRDKLVAVGFDTRREATNKIKEIYGNDVDILEQMHTDI